MCISVSAKAREVTSEAGFADDKDDEIRDQLRQMQATTHRINIAPTPRCARSGDSQHLRRRRRRRTVPWTPAVEKREGEAKTA
jgi:hypothetical protein